MGIFRSVAAAGGVRGVSQKPFRTLILWTIWAVAALVIYFTLYRDTGIWSFMETDPSRITWLIMGLFLLGVAASFMLTITITQEGHRATQLERDAREGGLNGIVVKAGARIADRFFRSLKATVESRGQPDVERLLHVELASLERVSHMIETAGSLLITLGLIGTVMGLTITLSGLTGSIEALGQDQELLMSGLREAMGGMGTAFYNTLLGAVLGGILLRVFAQINQHGVEAVHDNLMRICLVWCSSEYSMTLERDVRLLNDELRLLDEHVRLLKGGFQSSFEALREFRLEMQQFMRGSPSEGDESLRNLVQEHRAYCDALREEMRLLLHLRRPWWVRLLEVFRAPRP